MIRVLAPIVGVFFVVLLVAMLLTSVAAIRFTADCRAHGGTITVQHSPLIKTTCHGAVR